jgi:hypothetical protein
MTRAIQQGSSSVGCPVGNVTNILPPFIGSFATTPIANANPNDPCFSTGFTCLFMPAKPNANFGLPRTMLNPRQLQFSVRLAF